MKIRAATRGSALARWQTEHVAASLRAVDPLVEVEVVPVETLGDRRLDLPIAEIGGKGVFAKEVQAAVLDGRADIAVHSAKDLPSVTIDGLRLAAVPLRGDPRDALVGGTLAELPQSAVIGTGSSRRRVQLAKLRPDLRFAELRGNMATRLEKAEGFGAIVVAAAALQRLGLADRIDEVLPADVLIPQAGQGALAVECSAGEDALQQLLAQIEDPVSRRCVDAERAFLAELGGDCDLPAGAHAVVHEDGSISLTAVLAGAGGSPLHRRTSAGLDGAALGRAIAAELRSLVG